MGESIGSHENKAQLLYEADHDRLGTTEQNNVVFYLQNLILAPIDLSDLDSPFLDDDISTVVPNLPTSKALGPNGFNTDFMKNDGQLSLKISQIYVEVSTTRTYACKA